MRVEVAPPEEIIEQAPLLAGPPADDSAGTVPFSEWVQAWESFKASI